jgi:hypothetical protein
MKPQNQRLTDILWQNYSQRIKHCYCEMKHENGDHQGLVCIEKQIIPKCPIPFIDEIPTVQMKGMKRCTLIPMSH